MVKCVYVLFSFQFPYLSLFPLSNFILNLLVLLLLVLLLLVLLLFLFLLLLLLLVLLLGLSHLKQKVFRGRLWGTPVAVKKLIMTELTDEILSDMKQEVAILSQLRHPNVVLYIGIKK